MFRRRRGRSRYEVRQFSTAATFFVDTSSFSVQDTIVMQPATLGGSPEDAHLEKDFTLAIRAWYSDLAYNQSVVGDGYLTLYEYLYVADVNTAGASIYAGVPFSGANELAASDPRIMPTAIMLRRATLVTPVFGSPLSWSNNWHEPIIRVKRRIKSNQALFWRLEGVNGGVTTFQGNTMGFGAFALKANP